MITTNPVGSSAPAVSPTTDPAAAQTALNTNFQDFLKLLTTQLNNQDPTQPADVNQMTTEIAQMSQVQQQIASNNLLKQIVASLNAAVSSNAVSYIGKNIDASGNQLVLSGGKAELVYTLPAGAASANVTITTPTGQTIFSGPGTTIAGRNQVVWNGINSTTGTTMPDGNYNFTVTAKDASGAALTSTTYTSGTVAAVDTQNGTSVLSLGGGVTVPLNQVQSIYAAGSNPG